PKLFHIHHDKLLGEGAYSKVYQCISKGKTYAIKITRIDSHKYIKSVISELNILNILDSKEIKCEHIVEWIGMWIDMKQEKCYSVMEFVKNGELYGQLESHNLEQRMKWCYQIGLALQYLHEHCEIVFRD